MLGTPSNKLITQTNTANTNSQSRREQQRLENLRIAIKDTESFLSMAISCHILMINDSNTRKKLELFLTPLLEKIRPNGELYKFATNAFFLSKVDDEINNVKKAIYTFFKDIEKEKHSDFDLQCAKHILQGLSKLFEKWEAQYSQISGNPSQRWLALRPQAEQAICQQNATIKPLVEKVLENIKLLVTENYAYLNFHHEKENEQKPTCFISYAWPLVEEMPHELWTQAFILQFALDLRKAGINARIDLLHSRYGHNSISYMSKGIMESDFVILIGTESLLRKHEEDKKFGMAIRQEINKIKERIDKDRQLGLGDKVFCLLLNGTIETALPADFKGYTVIESFQEKKKGYLTILEETIARLYRTNSKNEQSAYWHLWKEARAISELEPLFNGLEDDAVKDYYEHYQQQNVVKKEQSTNKSRALVKNLLATQEHEVAEFKTPIIWKIDSYNRNFIGREKFLELLKQGLHTNNLPVAITAEALQVVSGMGGIGKTTLANVYANLNKGLYQIGYWINAEAGLSEGFFGLAKAINDQLAALEMNEWARKRIPVENLKPDEIREKVKEILRNTKNWLLIFDNVRDEEQMEGYLPTQDTNTRGHIIITSRLTKWRSAQVQALTVFEEKESLGLLAAILKDKLNHKGNSLIYQQQLINDLLAHLPLAIEEAAFTIAETPGMTIKLYNQKFLEMRDKLWRSDQSNDYKDKVAITLKLSIGALTKQAPLAESILNFCAYLASNRIPIKLLKNFIRHERFDDAIILLSKYSLVNIDSSNKYVSIHPLVQLVIKDELRNKRINIENMLLSYAEALYKDAIDPNQKIVRAKKLALILSHADSLIANFKKDTHLNWQFVQFIWFAAEEHKVIGDEEHIKISIEYWQLIEDWYLKKDPSNNRKLSSLYLNMALAKLALPNQATEDDKGAYADLQKALSKANEVQENIPAPESGEEKEDTELTIICVISNMAGETLMRLPQQLYRVRSPIELTYFLIEAFSKTREAFRILQNDVLGFYRKKLDLKPVYRLNYVQTAYVLAIAYDMLAELLSLLTGSNLLFTLGSTYFLGNSGLFFGIGAVCLIGLQQTFKAYSKHYLLEAVKHDAIGLIPDYGYKVIQRIWNIQNNSYLINIFEKIIDKMLNSYITIFNQIGDNYQKSAGLHNIAKLYSLMPQKEENALRLFQKILTLLSQEQYKEDRKLIEDALETLRDKISTRQLAARHSIIHNKHTTNRQPLNNSVNEITNLSSQTYAPN